MNLADYRNYLIENERSAATVEKYIFNVGRFVDWLGNRELSRELALEWKERLIGEGRSASTVNTAISALNGYFAFIGRSDCRLRFLKVQRRVFRDEKRDLTREEYDRLLNAAKSRSERLSLVMETICSCGLRVSEVRYITAEALERGEAHISMKGKLRTILLPGKLVKKLRAYAKKQGIISGPIFRTSFGNPLSRIQIWSEMKSLCRAAHVDPEKVFPHNLRHLFAVVYYKAHHDIVKLADILGHSSINTTRIYLISSGKEHQRQLEMLRLVS